MSHLEILMKSLDTAIWELGEAFTGMPDADLWRRPDPKLLSVGELAAHIAYGLASYFLGEEFESPLVLRAARYYPYSVEEPLSLDMGAEAVYNEVKRIYEASKVAVFGLNPDLDSVSTIREGWKWEDVMVYQAFHVAYHTGQIYSVRHMFGHETVDN